MRPAGLLPGHLGGLTSVSPRGDGVYLVSNAKDQTAKLWDLRRCAPGGPAARNFEFPYPFDYRYQAYPGTSAPATVHPHDASVMTFRGHSVLQTLIKAHFSPSSTGGRFIYSGSADGRVLIWDLLQAPGGGGGGVHAVLHGHRGPVRDVAWHPMLPLILSASFDGSLGVWTYDGDESATQQRVWRANRRTNAAATCAEAMISAPPVSSNAAAAPRAPPLPDGLTCIRRVSARDHQDSPEGANGGREDVDGVEDDEEEVDDVEVDDDEDTGAEDVRNALFSGDADDDDDGSVLRALLAAVLAQSGSARGGGGGGASGGGSGNGT